MSSKELSRFYVWCLLLDYSGYAAFWWRGPAARSGSRRVMLARYLQTRGGTGHMVEGRTNWRDQRRTVVVRAVSALSLSLALLALSGTSSSAVPRRTGVVADSGFRPGANGFTFANYGAMLASGTLPTNLTPAEMTALFGNAVCADAAIGKCDLIPEAQAWMDQMNQEMAGGHCFGFSVAADLVWQDKVNTSRFGAATINGLAIDNNASLQSTIAEGWVYQTLASVQAKQDHREPQQDSATNWRSCSRPIPRTATPSPSGSGMGRAAMLSPRTK